MDGRWSDFAATPRGHATLSHAADFCEGRWHLAEVCNGTSPSAPISLLCRTFNAGIVSGSVEVNLPYKQVGSTINSVLS